ncbi:hypothetical protein TTHT_1987 [Thermotomaculum hydrothermale]|uniref:Uncharacterized protein n=1 Tax=Thermotomaculum hydrothermale TaxID=981385 RepID=A0A7R6SZ67_9BACT|nr:hypothetical protein [Thermotomaculum hydrothermale]BBB33430.1 hypothetical protein TTHT_1987 [Thermotomaculum hydrothermale]
MRKMGIIIFLLSLSFLSSAESFKGAFFFQGNVYYIGKSGDRYSVVLKGKELASFKGLKAYYSNGYDKAVFLTEKKEIIWFKDKVFEVDVNLNPVLDFDGLKFYRLLLKNENFVFIGDLNPSVFDLRNGKLYKLPFLYSKAGRMLFLVSPEDILFTENCFIFFSKPYLIAYSIESKKPVFMKKVNFEFVSFSGFKNGMPYFEFDYKTPLYVDLKDKKVELQKKLENDNMIFYGQIGELKGLKIFLDISGKGFSTELNATFKVYKNGKLVFEKEIEGLKVDLNNLLNFRPFVFSQIEKAVMVNFPDRKIFLCKGKQNKIKIKVVIDKTNFSVVNGEVLTF